MSIIVLLPLMKMMIFQKLHLHVAQAHKNFIQELSNTTFVYDDGQQLDAHGSINSSLNMSLEMEEVGGNIVDLEFENNPDEEEDRSLIQNAKKNLEERIDLMFWLIRLKIKSNLKVIGQHISLMICIIITVAEL